MVRILEPKGTLRDSEDVHGTASHVFQTYGWWE